MLSLPKVLWNEIFQDTMDGRDCAHLVVTCQCLHHYIHSNNFLASRLLYRHIYCSRGIDVELPVIKKPTVAQQRRLNNLLSWITGVEYFEEYLIPYADGLSSGITDKQQFILQCDAYNVASTEDEFFQFGWQMEMLLGRHLCKLKHIQFPTLETCCAIHQTNQRDCFRCYRHRGHIIEITIEKRAYERAFLPTTKQSRERWIRDRGKIRKKQRQHFQSANAPTWRVWKIFTQPNLKKMA